MTDQPISHTREFIRNFVIPSRRERLLYLLEHRRNFKGFSDQSKFIESKMIQIVPDTSCKPYEFVTTELKRRGAPNLARYIFESSTNGDGDEEPLEDLLKENVGLETWAIISCIPGKLAYWEGEGKNNRFILCG